MSIYRYFIFCWRYDDWPAEVTDQSLPAGLIADEL